MNEGDRAPEGAINISTAWEKGQGTISFCDNGAGLTESEIHEYLSTIGRSGTRDFRDDLIRKGRKAEATVIGQFGIGLLSAFVVATRVEVETRGHLPGQPAWRWVSEGQKDYELGPGSRREAGTTVTLTIASDYRDMLNADELRKAIRKYADFIPFPITINDEDGPTNAVNAPWHRQYADEKDRVRDYWTFAAARFPDNPLGLNQASLATSSAAQIARAMPRQNHTFEPQNCGQVACYDTRENSLASRLCYRFSFVSITTTTRKPFTVVAKLSSGKRRASER